LLSRLFQRAAKEELQQKLNDWIDDAEAQATLADAPSNSVEPKMK
jgi:hypothetical protein